MSIIWSVSLHAWFEHGRAVDAANTGDWHRANSLLTTKLVNHPDDPCVVYDAGVAAYKVGDHEQARAYFDHVTQLPHVSDGIKERAYFNAGNAHVALKQLEEAITRYEQALRIDAHDERARHNLEIVKKMLQEQQKKEQENKEQEKEDKENKQQDQQQDESSGESDDESGDDKNQDSSGGNEDKKPSCAKAPAGTQQDMKQQEASSSAKATVDKQEQGKKSQEDKKSDAYQHMQQVEAKLDKRLLRLLEQQETHDAQVNKQMIKATVGNQMGDKHGKNCW
jgi:tetratricopeptide (TPR) repeat protein